MITVCEVCYTTNGEEYFSITDGEKNILQIVSQHLQCVTIEGIEQPQICSACWSMLDNFNQFYNAVEELHRPQPDSSGSDDEFDELEPDASLQQERNGTTEVNNDAYDDQSNSYHPTDCSQEETEELYDDEEVAQHQSASSEVEENVEERSFQEIDTVDNSTGEQAEYHDAEVRSDDQEDSKEAAVLNGSEKDADQELLAFYGPMSCEICQRVRGGLESPPTEFETFLDLKRHLLGAHEMRKCWLRCPLCSKRIYFRSRLLQHISIHRDPEPFRCSVCGEVHQNLEHHMKVEHHDKSMECTECGKRFSVKSRLRMHMKITHAPKNVVCDVCNKVFNKYRIKNHLRTMHGGPEYVCEHCGRTYCTIALLKKHMGEHRGEREAEKMPCPVCQVPVRCKYFSRHMKVMHTQYDREVCGRCGKSFRNKKTLKIHLYHSCPESMHSCNLCDKKFKTVIKLREHEASHKESGFYLCSVCLMQFGSKSQLFRHQQDAEAHKPHENREGQGVNKSATDNSRGQ